MIYVGKWIAAVYSAGRHRWTVILSMSLSYYFPKHYELN